MWVQGGRLSPALGVALGVVAPNILGDIDVPCAIPELSLRNSGKQGSLLAACVEALSNSRRRSVMYKKLLSLSLVALLTNFAGVPPAHASAKEEKDARFAGKVKASLLKLGSGEAARVKVRLRDKTKLEGYISGAGEEAFTVTHPKTGVATTVAYPQVKSVRGHNLSTGAKVAIGVGIAAAVIFIILWYTTGPGSD